MRWRERDREIVFRDREREGKRGGRKRGGNTEREEEEKIREKRLQTNCGAERRSKGRSLRWSVFKSREIELE
jgi:hypothetical protein